MLHTLDKKLIITLGYTWQIYLKALSSIKGIWKSLSTLILSSITLNVIPYIVFSLINSWLDYRNNNITFKLNIK